MAPEFSRISREDDALKQESTCNSCSAKISAYTMEVLNDKELAHKCRDKSPLPLALVGKPPKEKRY
jgi:hypothetical protein